MNPIAILHNSKVVPDPFYDILDPKIQNWAQKVPKLAQSMVGLGWLQEQNVKGQSMVVFELAAGASIMLVVSCTTMSSNKDLQ